MSPRRLLLLPGLAAALCLALTGSASASSAYRDTGLAPMTTPGAVNSDCGIRARLFIDDAGYLHGQGYASCNSNKQSVQVQIKLQRTDPYGNTVVREETSVFSLRVPTWIQTGGYGPCGGGYKWQSLTKAWVTDNYGRTTYSYITTGTPLAIC